MTYLTPENTTVLPHSIGVFDSGVGGLSVLREIRRELPREHLIYVADSGHAPYGDKTPAAIAARASIITEFLLNQGVKAIVIACNTATGVAARLLRQRYPLLPIVAMEPAVKPAAARTRSGVIGVLATRQTLASPTFAALTGRFAHRVQIVPQPCPGLVEQVEAGDLDGAITRALLTNYLAPPLARGADTLVLGCTHYPHLTPIICELTNENVLVLDSGVAVARQLNRRLTDANLHAPIMQIGLEQFWTTGDLTKTQKLLTQLWNKKVNLLPLPKTTARHENTQKI